MEPRSHNNDKGNQTHFGREQHQIEPLLVRLGCYLHT